MAQAGPGFARHTLFQEEAPSVQTSRGTLAAVAPYPCHVLQSDRAHQLGPRFINE